MLQFCCKFTSVSVCQNYQNTMQFDSYCKDKRVQFLCFRVQLSIVCRNMCLSCRLAVNDILSVEYVHDRIQSEAK